MNGLSNTHHLRKMVAGICMVGAPLLLLLALIVESAIGTSEDSYVIGRVGDPDTGSLEQMLLVGGLVLMVPAVLAAAAGFESEALGILGSAAMLVGLGGTGLIVLRESDEDWEHTPHRGGPVAA